MWVCSHVTKERLCNIAVHIAIFLHLLHKSTFSTTVFMFVYKFPLLYIRCLDVFFFYQHPLPSFPVSHMDRPAVRSESWAAEAVNSIVGKSCITQMMGFGKETASFFKPCYLNDFWFVIIARGKNIQKTFSALLCALVCFVCIFSSTWIVMKMISATARGCLHHNHKTNEEII